MKKLIFIAVCISGCSASFPIERIRISEVPAYKLAQLCTPLFNVPEVTNSGSLTNSMSGGASIAGCYVTDGDECHIFMANDMPTKKRDIVLLHELRHCREGDFHNNDGTER